VKIVIMLEALVAGLNLFSIVSCALSGSTLYAMETGEHPAILRNSVTSPAGTTASAIYELEKGGLRPLGKRLGLFVFVADRNGLQANYKMHLSLVSSLQRTLAVNDAIWACYRRSLEMGGKNPSVGPGRNRSMGETSQIVHNHIYNGPSGEMKMFDEGDSDDDDDDNEAMPTKTA
jgi:hypothetical protein